MKILLLTAPIPVQNVTFPIGLSYVGTVLKQNRHEVKIIDSIAPFKKYTKDDIKELIKNYKPDIVGFSLFINFITHRASECNTERPLFGIDRIDGESNERHAARHGYTPLG